MKKNILGFITSGIWISLSEFVRNELVLKTYWLGKYKSLGLVFPADSINNALWGLWSFMLAGVIVFLFRKLRFFETIVISWIMAFCMMWVVIGNLNVLPVKLLLFAVPWSFLEVTIAALLCKRFNAD